jgi:hypothetical protein
VLAVDNFLYPIGELLEMSAFIIRCTDELGNIQLTRSLKDMLHQERAILAETALSSHGVPSDLNGLILFSS